MRSKKVTQTVEAFEKLEKAQAKWDEMFNDLDEEEEAELERRLFVQGVTIGKPKNCEKESPVTGQDIYVPSAAYLSHGKDDFQGGLCRVIEIEKGRSEGKLTYYVRVAERPNFSYNWLSLKQQQEELKKRYGDKRGHAEPDNSAESNDNESGWINSSRKGV